MYSSLLGGTAKTMSNKTPKTPFSALLSKEEKHFPAGYTDPEGHKGGQFAPKDTTGEVAQETKEKPFVYSDGQTSLVNSMAVNKPKEPTAPDVSPEDLIAHHKAGLEKSAKLLNQYIKQDGGKPTDTNAKILAGNIANHVDALSDLGGMSKEELAKGLSTQGLSMWLKKKHGLPLTAQEEKNIASTMKSAIALQNKKQAAKKLEDHKKNSALAEEAKVKFGEDSAQYKKLKNKAEKDLNKAMSYGVLPADAVKEKEVVKENHDAEKVAQLKAIHDAAEELAHQEHMGTQNTAYYNAVSDAVAAAKYADENETNKAIEAGKATNAAKIANGKTLLSISVIAHAQVQHQQHEAKDSDAYKEYKDAANAYKYYYNTGAIYNGLNKDDLKQAVKTGKLAFSSMKANKNMEKVAPPDVPGFEKLAPAPKPAVEVKPESPKTFSDISSEAKAKDGLQQLVDLTTSYNAHMTMPNNQTYYSDFLEAKKNFDTTMGVGYSDKALAAYYALKNNLVDSQAKDKEAEKEAQKKDFFGGLDYLKAYPNDKEASAKLADNHKEINDTYGAGTTLAWLKEYNAKNKQVEPKTFSDFVNDAKGKGNTGKLAYMTNAYSDHKAAPTPDTQAMLNGAKASLDASMGAGYSDKAIAAYDTATTAKPLATSPDGMMLAKDKSDYFKAIDSTPDSPKGEADPKLMQMKLDIDKKYGDGTANSWIAEKIKGMHADAAVKENVKASYLSILNYANPDASQQSAIAEMKKNIDAKYGDGTATTWMTENIKAVGQAATAKSYDYGKQEYNLTDTKADALAALRIPHTLDDKSDLIQNIIDKAKADIDLASGVKDAGLKYLNGKYTDHSNDNPNPEFSNFAKEVATKMLVDAQAKVDSLVDPILELSKKDAVKALTGLKQDVDKYLGQGASADLLDSYDEAKADHKKQFFAKMDAVQGGKANADNALALGMHINKVDELFGKGTSSLWADEFNSKKLWADAYGGNPPKPVDQKAEDKKKYINSYIANMVPEHKPIEQTMNAKYGVDTVQGWVKDFNADKKMLQGKNLDYLDNPSPEAVAAISSTTKTIDAAYGDGTAKYMLTGHKPDVLGSKPKPTQEDKDYLLAASDTLAATGAKVADAVDFAKKVKMFNSIYGEGAASAYIKEAKNLKIPNDMDVSGVNGTTPLAWKEIIKDNYDSSVSSLVFHSSDVEDYPQLSNVDKSYGTGMHQYWLTQHIESLDKEAKTTAPTPTTSSPTQALLDAGNKLGASGAKIRDMIIFASKVTEYNNLYGEGYASKHLADTDSLVIPSDDTVDQNGKTAAECKKSLGDSYDAAVKNAYATNQAIPVYAKTANASFGLATYNYWLAQHIEQLAQGKSSPAPITPVDPKAVKAATAKMKKSVLAAAKALIANPTSPQHAAAFSSLLSDADAKYGSGTALKWIGAANKKEAKANTGTVAALEMPKELNDVIAVGDSVNTASKTQVPKLPDVLPTDKTEAEALNEKLGLAYYTIRHENGGDKNAPDVLASYKVWDTLKDHMKANLGYDKSFFSSSSSDLNSKAQSLWDNSGQAAADKKAKATSDYVDSVAAWSAEASKKNIDPDNEDYLKDMMVTNAKQAVIAGVPSNTIGTLFESGKANSAAFVKKQKDDAMKEIAAASHDYFMKSGLKGEDDPETKAANMNALNIMAKHSMLLSEAEKIDAFGRSKGAAEKTVANMKLLGDLGAAAQKYDSGEINCKWAPKGSDEFNQAKAVGDALWKSLTPSQRSAFTSYTGSGHKGVNKNLAQGTTTDLADVLSKAMDGQSLGVDVKLGRNMPQKWFWKAMGLPNDTRAEMNNLTDEQLQACVGKVYHEPGISSTSYDQDCGVSVTNTGDQSGYLKLHIRAAKDISQGLWIDTHSTCSSEREVMLNKGATYLIRGIQRNDTSSYGPYSYTIDLDLIGYTQEPKK